MSEAERVAARDFIATALCDGDYNTADDVIGRLYGAGWDITPRYDRDTGPWPFLLVRDEDVTGVSGEGVVAEGVEFTGGVVALRWLSAWPTSVVFHDKGMESVQAVHGHSGKTRVVYK